MTRQQSKLKKQMDNDDEKKILPTLSYNMKSNMTVVQIKEALDSLQVKYDGKLKKQDLFILLEKNQINSDPIKKNQQNIITEKNATDVKKVEPSIESSKAVETKTSKYKLRSIDTIQESPKVLNSDFNTNNNQPLVISTSRSKSVHSSPHLNETNTELKRKRSPATKSDDYIYPSLTPKTKRTQKSSPMITNENTTSHQQNISTVPVIKPPSPSKSDVSEVISHIEDTVYSNQRLFSKIGFQVTQLVESSLIEQPMDHHSEIEEEGDSEDVDDEEDVVDDEDDDEEGYYDVADYIMQQDQDYEVGVLPASPSLTPGENRGLGLVTQDVATERNENDQEVLVNDWQETDSSEELQENDEDIEDNEDDEAMEEEEEEEEVNVEDNDEYDQDDDEDVEEEEDSNGDDLNKADGDEQDNYTDENMEEDDDSIVSSVNQIPQSFMGYISSSFTNNFSYSHANEVVDLVSSDDEDITTTAPCPPVVVATSIPTIAQPIVVKDSVSSVVETIAIPPVSEEKHSEVAIEVVVDSNIAPTNTILTQNDEASKEIEHVKQALTKLGNRFVSVVASNLTKEGDSCTDNKLTEEDYYLLRTYLEKNKPVSISVVDVAKSSVRFTEEKSFIEPMQASSTKITGGRPNISIDTSVGDIQRDGIEIDNSIYAPTSTYIPTPAPSQMGKTIAISFSTNDALIPTLTDNKVYAPTSTYIPTPAPAQMGKTKAISFSTNDAAIPRSSYDGGSWTSRESFLPSIPDTPLASSLGKEASFKPSTSSTQGKQLFENVKQNKRSIYEAGFSDVNTAHAGATPFHIDRSLDSAQASKRVSLDGYRSIVSRQATPGVGVFDRFSDTPLSMGMGSMPASRIGSGEIGFSLGVPKFQVRQSYTPMFRGNSVQFSSSSHRIDSAMNNSIVSESKPTMTSLNTLANSSSVNSTGVTLSYIQRRRLQREAASSQSAAMAQKILQTLTGITSPLEQQRHKPIPITWKDEINPPSNTVTHTDSTIIVPKDKIDSNNLISKPEETKNVTWSISDTQSPFLHNSLRSKPPSTESMQGNIVLQETKNNITDKSILSKVSFEFPKSISTEKSNQIPILSSTTAPVDQEFTFEEPIIVSGIEENETEVKRRNSEVSVKSFNTDQKIKYMFSAYKTKPIQPIAPTIQKSTINTNISDKFTKTSEVAPSINIWAANSLNDGIKCKVCMVKNKKDAIKCASCESSLELASSVAIVPTVSVNAPIPPANNIWAASSLNDGIKCKVCMVKNKKDAIKCASCESILDTTVATTSSSNNNKPLSNVIVPSFTFGVKSDTIINIKSEEKKLETSTIGFDFGTASSSSKSSFIAPVASSFSTGTTTGFTFNTVAVDTKTSIKPAFEQLASTKSDVSTTFDTSKPLIKPFEAIKEDDKRKPIPQDEDDDQPKNKRKTFGTESDQVTSNNMAQFPIVSKPFTFNTQNSEVKSDSSNTGFVFGSISNTLSNSAPPLLSDNSSKPFSFQPPSSNVNKIESAKISFGSTIVPETKQTEVSKSFMFGDASVKSDVKPLDNADTKPSASTSFMFGSNTNASTTSTIETTVKPFSFDSSKAISFSSAPVADTSKPFTFGANTTQNDATPFGTSLSNSKLSVESTHPVVTQPFMFGSSNSSFPNITPSTASATTTTTTTGSFSNNSNMIGSTTLGPFSSGSGVSSTIGSTAFGNVATSDVFKLGATAFGTSSLSSLGKPPLATSATNTLGSTSLMFPSNGVASVDQLNTNRTITPTPTTFGTQNNTITMDSPNSTMDIGSGGSNLSAPNTFPNPTVTTTTTFGSTSNTNPFSTMGGSSSNVFGTSNSNTSFSFPANPFGQVASTSSSSMFGNIINTNIPLFNQQSQVSSNISGPFSTSFGQQQQGGFNLNTNTSSASLGIIPTSNAFNTQQPTFGNTSLSSIQSHSSVLDYNSNSGGGFSLGATDNKNNQNNQNRRKILKAKRPGGV